MPETVPNILHTFSFSISKNPMERTTVLILIFTILILYTVEYYSAIKKNTFESVLMRWMKLEPINQSEVSQKEKHQYSMLLLLSRFSRV